MNRVFLLIAATTFLLGCNQVLERNVSSESSITSTSSTSKAPRQDQEKIEGYCRSLTSQVAAVVASEICPDSELCYDLGEHCFVGSTELGEIDDRESVVVLDDSKLLTYSRVTERQWKLIRSQNIRWLQVATGIEPPELALIEMSFVDVTNDGVDELVVRAGPEDILLAAQSRDLAVFKWSTENSSWIRLTFPRPIYPDWGTETENISHRLLRWGFVRDGFVYEEVGYLKEGGHIMEESIKYEWREGDFVQVDVVDEGAACFDVVGVSNGLCFIE